MTDIKETKIKRLNYYIIEYIINNESVWKIKITDSELLNGIIAGGQWLIKEINKYSEKNKYNKEKVNLIWYENNKNNKKSKVEAVKYNMDEDEISTFKCVDLPKTYGLWIKNDHNALYNLYTFNKSSFIQGVLSICNYFKYDFRDIIYGFPFNKFHEQFGMSNYLLISSSVIVNIPDLNDIDDENMDNENFLEPLKKDY